MKEINRKIVELPITIEVSKNGSISIISIKTKKKYFTEPFFIDSLVKNFNISESQVGLPKENELLARPVHYDSRALSVVKLDLDKYIKKYGQSVSLKDFSQETCYIFHMSRCGSTLLTQMLSLVKKFYVLSEPTIINAVLDPHLKINDTIRKSLLRACLNNLFITKPDEAKKLVIKFRSWNTILINLIQDSTPNVPWIFMHRKGSEVLASVLNKKPGWLRSKKLYSDFFSKVLRINKEDVVSMNEDEFSIMLLSQLCEKALGADQNYCNFIDYTDIKSIAIDLIEEKWKIKLSDSEKKVIISSSNIYSKDINKKTLFVSDTEDKQRLITKEQNYLIKKLLEINRKKLYASKNNK